MRKAFATTAPVRAAMMAAGLSSALLLASCQGATETQQRAEDFDNAEQQSVEEEMRAQRQADEQQRQQEQLLQLQQDCQDLNSLEVPEPSRSTDAAWPAGAILLISDLQLAWGGGSNDHNRKKYKPDPC